MREVVPIMGFVGEQLQKLPEQCSPLLRSPIKNTKETVNPSRLRQPSKLAGDKSIQMNTVTVIFLKFNIVF